MSMLMWWCARGWAVDIWFSHFPWNCGLNFRWNFHRLTRTGLEFQLSSQMYRRSIWGAYKYECVSAQTWAHCEFNKCRDPDWPKFRKSLSLRASDSPEKFKLAWKRIYVEFTSITQKITNSSDQRFKKIRIFGIFGPKKLKEKEVSTLVRPWVDFSDFGRHSSYSYAPVNPFCSDSSKKTHRTKNGRKWRMRAKKQENTRGKCV